MGVTATAMPVNVGQPIEYKEDYQLFFVRLNSLLYNTPWITCEQAKAKFFEKRFSALESLCLLADDNTLLAGEQ